MYRWLLALMFMGMACSCLFAGWDAVIAEKYFLGLVMLIGAPIAVLFALICMEE